MNQTPPRMQPRNNVLKDFFSLSALKRGAAEVWRRFPVSTVFACVYAAYAIAMIWDAGFITDFNVGANVGLSMGLLLSVCIRQWGDYYGASERKVLAWQALSVGVALLNFFYLTNFLDRVGIPGGIRYAAAYVAILVGIFFLPPGRKPSAANEWNYGTEMLGTLGLGYGIVLVTAFFAAMVMVTLELLFDLIDSEVLLSLYTVLYTIIGLYILGRLPRPEARADAEAVYPKAGNFGLYVLLPLTVVYGLILYCYGAKTIFELELPRASICESVTGMTAAVILVVFWMRGVMLQDGPGAERRKRIAALALKVLPAALLPLLVLMSVSIFYRIGQYGLTPNRLYMLAFNLWAYAAMVYLLTRGARINIVAGSFAIVFAAISVFPRYNFYEYGRECVREKVRDELLKAGAEKLPVSYAELTELAAEMPEEERESLIADLAWLDDYQDHSGVKGLVSHQEKISEWSLEHDVDEIAGKKKAETLNVTLAEADEETEVPAGSRTMRRLSREFFETRQGDEKGRILAESKDGEVYDIAIDSIAMSRKGKGTEGAISVRARSGERMIVITQLNYTPADSSEKAGTLYLYGYEYKH